MRITKENLKKIPFWIYPLVISLLLFPLTTIHASADSALYLDQAKKVYNFNFGVYRPAFVGLLAIYFHIFGVSVKSFYLLVRTFYVLNHILVYFLGKELYGKRVGLLTSLLAIFSFTLFKWSNYLLLDIVWPFFMLLAIYLVIKAYRANSIVWSLLSGTCLGVSFLIKSVAIVIFPFPILSFLLISKFRRKNNIKYVITILLTALIFPLLWYLYLGDFSMLFGKGGTKVADRLITVDKNIFLTAVTLIGMYTKAIISFFNSVIKRNFAYGYPFILSWVFILYRSFKRNDNDIILLLCGLLWSPFLIPIEKFNLRVGQNVFFFILNYIVLASTIFFLYTKIININKLERIKERYEYFVVPLIMMLVIVPQLTWSDCVMPKFLKERALIVNRLSGGQKSLSISGWYGEKVENAADWMNKNLPPNSRILCPWYLGRSMKFYVTRHKVLIIWLYQDLPFESPPKGLIFPLTGEKFKDAFGLNDPDLVGAWISKGETGRTLYDLSSSKNHGILNGPIWNRRSTKGTLNFDGKNDYVDIQNDSSLNFGASTDFTISLWFYPRDGSSEMHLIDKKPDAGWAIRCNKGRIVPWVTDKEGNSFYRWIKFYDVGKWNHVAMVLDRDGTGYLYHNGVEKCSEDIRDIGDIDNIQNVYIGSAEGGSYFNGVMADVRVYSRALFSNEVRGIYNQRAIATKPLFLFLAGGKTDLFNARIVAIFEEDLNRKLSKLSGDYILCTPRHGFLSLYYDKNPNYELIKSFSDGYIKLYKVRKITNGFEFDTLFGAKLYKFLRNMKEKDPERFRKTEKELKVFGWSLEDIKRSIDLNTKILVKKSY